MDDRAGVRLNGRFFSHVKALFFTPLSTAHTISNFCVMLKVEWFGILPSTVHAVYTVLHAASQCAGAKCT